jgi:hypothetical protein
MKTIIPLLNRYLRDVKIVSTKSNIMGVLVLALKHSMKKVKLLFSSILTEKIKILTLKKPVLT